MHDKVVFFLPLFKKVTAFGQTSPTPQTDMLQWKNGVKTKVESDDLIDGHYLAL